MGLETAITKLIEHGTVPIELISRTSWPQFIISALITLFVGSIMIFIMNSGSNSSSSIKGHFAAKKFSKLTRRDTIIVNHAKQGLFGGSMITQETVNDVTRAMTKLNGKPFNLVLHSGGGEVFSATLLSSALHNYPGEIHTYVPRFAMSGATILALSTTKLHMNKYSCLGMTDVQIGGLLSSGSAAAWNEVVRAKGTKAGDNAFIYRRLGNQATITMKNHVKKIITGKTKQVDKVAEVLTDGKREHIFQFNAAKLRGLGFTNIEKITPTEEALLGNMVG